MKIIPHRESFLFLDEVVSLNEGKDVVKKRVGEDEFWVKGHFPNFAVCPGVLALEMLAQAGAIYILYLRKRRQDCIVWRG